MLVTLEWWQFKDVDIRIIMIAPFHYVSDFFNTGSILLIRDLAVEEV